MPKLKTTPTITTTTETTVKLSTKARQMVRARCEENASLSAQIKALEARQRRLKTEVEDLFLREDQGDALLDGCAVDGHRVRLVISESKEFDKLGFMKEHGLSEEDFEAFTTAKPREPYVRITSPREKKETD